MTRMATTVVALLTLWLGSGAATPVGAAQTSPLPSRPIRWLAAGDSFSAGEGLVDPSDPDCQRAFRSIGHSSAAWAKVALEQTRVAVDSFDFVACTGAVTEDLLDDIGRKRMWEASKGRYDLVTFSFGGNNVGFDSIFKQCLGVDAAIDGALTVTGATAAWLTKGGCPAETDLRQRVADLGGGGLTTDGRRLRGYKEFLIDVANRVTTPGGNIVVAGYPELIEEAKFWPTVNKTFGICQGIRRGDAPVLRGVAGALNQAIGEAVAQVDRQRPNGVHLTFVDVNTGNPTIGYGDENLFEPNRGKRHNLCAAEPWLNGIGVGLTSGNFRPQRSFHPTQLGHDHMGALVVKVVNDLDWRDLGAGAPPVTSTTTTVSSALTNVWRVAARRSDGLSWTYVLEAGEVVPATNTGQLTIPATIARACRLDAQRDALVPLRLTVVRDQTTFGGKISASFILASRSLEIIDSAAGAGDRVGISGAQSVDVASSTSSGPSCMSVTNVNYGQFAGIGLTYSDKGQGRSDLLLVLRGYYTPAMPLGDPSYLPKVWFAAQPDSVIENSALVNYSITSMTGPGVVRKAVDFGGNSFAYFFPLDGKSSRR